MSTQLFYVRSFSRNIIISLGGEATVFLYEARRRRLRGLVLYILLCYTFLLMLTSECYVRGREGGGYTGIGIHQPLSQMDSAGRFQIHLVRTSLLTATDNIGLREQ